MQSVSITSTSLKPLCAPKTVINCHYTGEAGTTLIEWSHIKPKAKHHPNDAQVKMHLAPSPTPCCSHSWHGGGSPGQDQPVPTGWKFRGSVPSVPHQRMEQPVYGACNANLSSALLHNSIEGLRGSQTWLLSNLQRWWSACHCLCTTHTGNLAVPPPKPSQSAKHHKLSSLSPQLRGWRL